MNRGAWLLTEEIVECYRDIEPLKVIGGVVWGKNSSDDYWLNSHGVATPDAYWKVVVAKDQVIAWIVPNSADAKRNKLDQYIVRVAELEGLIGAVLPVAERLKAVKTTRSWRLPTGCDKG